MREEGNKKIHVDSETFYPYIEFPETWEQMKERFGKKFRYNLRSRKKKLEQIGEVSITCYSSPDQTAEFLEKMLGIERNSWKESSGTSITTNANQKLFHTKLAEAASQRGMLQGYVMELSHKPIAHIYGLYWQNTFFCLKSSICEEFRKYSPGVVLKAMVMERLVNTSAGYWDFVGPSEDHKLRWTKDNYSIRNYIVFNTTVMGQLLEKKMKMGNLFRELKNSGATEYAG